MRYPDFTSTDIHNIDFNTAIKDSKVTIWLKSVLYILKKMIATQR